MPLHFHIYIQFIHLQHSSLATTLWFTSYIVLGRVENYKIFLFISLLLLIQFDAY